MIEQIISSGSDLEIPIRQDFSDQSDESIEENILQEQVNRGETNQIILQEFKSSLFEFENLKDTQNLNNELKKTLILEKPLKDSI